MNEQDNFQWGEYTSFHNEEYGGEISLSHHDHSNQWLPHHVVNDTSYVGQRNLLLDTTMAAQTFNPCLLSPSSAVTPSSTVSEASFGPITPHTSNVYDEYSSGAVIVDCDTLLGATQANPYTGQSNLINTVDPQYDRQGCKPQLVVDHAVPILNTDQSSEPPKMPRTWAERPVATSKFIEQSNGRRKHLAKFFCDRCGQTFTARHNLEFHQTAHTGEKRYKCENCGRGFTVPYSKNRHMKKGCPKGSTVLIPTLGYASP